MHQAERSARTWTEQSRSNAFVDHRGLRLVRLARLVRGADYRLRVSDRLRTYLRACWRRELFVWSRRMALAAASAAIIGFFAYKYNAGSSLLAAADQALANNDPLRAGALAFAALPPPGSIIRINQQRALALLAKSNLAFARGVFQPGGSATDAGIKSVAFSPDGRFLATATVGGAVVVWATDSGIMEKRIELSPGLPVQVVKYSPSGDAIAAGGAAALATLIDTRSWQMRSGPRVHTAPINDLAFDRSGSSILTVSVDRSAIVWDAASLGMRAKLALPDAGQLNCVALGGDGSIVVGTTDNTLWRWASAADPAPGTIFTSQSQVQTCELDRDGKRAVAGTENGLVTLIDVGTAKSTELVNVVGQGVWMVAFSPDGQFIASGWDDGMLRLTLSPVTGASPPSSIEVAFHRGTVRSVAFDITGGRMASASYDGSAVVWDVGALRARDQIDARRVFQSVCNSALASRLTLWRNSSTDAGTFTPTGECACARAGALSTAFWKSLITQAANPSTASHCKFLPRAG